MDKHMCCAQCVRTQEIDGPNPYGCCCLGARAKREAARLRSDILLAEIRTLVNTLDVHDESSGQFLSAATEIKLKFDELDTWLIDGGPVPRAWNQ